MNISYKITEYDKEIHAVVRVPEHDVGDHQYTEHYVFPKIMGENEVYLEHWEQDGEGQHTGISDVRTEILAMIGSLGYSIMS